MNGGKGRSLSRSIMVLLLLAGTVLLLSGALGVSVGAAAGDLRQVAATVEEPAESGWSVEDSGTVNNLNSVCAVDVLTAWAVGDGGTILKTGDAGATWDVQDSGTTANLLGISAVDGMTAWAVGTGAGSGGAPFPVLLKTSDGGGTWEPQALDTAVIDSVKCVSAGDADHVLIGGGKSFRPVVLATSDGGETWTAGNTGISEYYYAPSAAASAGIAAAWVVQGGGNMDLTFGGIARSVDGGLNWTVQEKGGIWWKDVSAVDEQTVWVVGDYFLYYPPARSGQCCVSGNGGTTWKAITLPNNLVSPRISAVDAETAWVIGGTAWSSSYSKIWKTTDGGGAWSKQTDMAVYIRDIDAVDGDNAWAVGSSGLVLHTTDGGSAIPPTIASITPAEGSQLNLWFGISDLAGTDFVSGAQVRLEKGDAVLDAFFVNVVSETKITCTVNLMGAEPGAYDVVVVNPDGGEARLSEGFLVVSVCGQGAGASLAFFGLMMGFLTLAGSGIFARRFRGSKTG